MLRRGPTPTPVGKGAGCQVSGQEEGEGPERSVPDGDQLVEIKERERVCVCGAWGHAAQISHRSETPRRGNWEEGLCRGNRMEGGDTDAHKCSFQGRWALRTEARGRHEGPCWVNKAP